MQLVTQINTVFEEEYDANHNPKVVIEHPKGLTLEDWEQQNLGPGWEQFHVGVDCYGYSVENPARTVWVRFEELTEKCYICGRGPHSKTGHAFWSEADAASEFSAEPIPSGYSPEAAYVDQHRPH